MRATCALHDPCTAQCKDSLVVTRVVCLDEGSRGRGSGTGKPLGRGCHPTGMPLQCLPCVWMLVPTPATAPTLVLVTPAQVSSARVPVHDALLMYSPSMPQQPQRKVWGSLDRRPTPDLQSGTTGTAEQDHRSSDLASGSSSRVAVGKPQEGHPLMPPLNATVATLGSSSMLHAAHSLPLEAAVDAVDQTPNVCRAVVSNGPT